MSKDNFQQEKFQAILDIFKNNNLKSLINLHIFQGKDLFEAKIAIKSGSVIISVLRCSPQLDVRFFKFNYHGQLTDNLTFSQALDFFDNETQTVLLFNMELFRGLV